MYAFVACCVHPIVISLQLAVTPAPIHSSLYKPVDRRAGVCTLRYMHAREMLRSSWQTPGHTIYRMLGCSGQHRLHAGRTATRARPIMDTRAYTAAAPSLPRYTHIPRFFAQRVATLGRDPDLVVEIVLHLLDPFDRFLHWRHRDHHLADPRRQPVLDADALRAGLDQRPSVQHALQMRCFIQELVVFENACHLQAHSCAVSARTRHQAQRSGTWHPVAIDDRCP